MARPEPAPAALQAPRLSLAQKLAYGMGDTVIAVRLTAFQFYLLPFYTDVVVLAPWLAGLARMLGLVWDGINDPLAGWVSDRTRTRYGRRRPFLLAAAIPLGLTFGLLWAPPAGLGALAAFGWLVLAYVVFDSCVTFYATPYLALGAELSDDYHERTQLSATRSAFHVVGLLAGGVVPAFVLQAYAPERATGFLVMGLGMGAAMTMIALGTGLLVRERPRDVPAPHGPFTLRTFAAGLAATLRNRAFRVLLLTFALIQTGGGCYQTLVPYAFQYWLRMPDRVGSVVGVYMVASVVSLPLWTRLAWWLGKDRALRVCIGWGAIALALSPVVLDPEMPATRLYAFLVLAGLGSGGWNVLPIAITADVIDADELETRQRREGAYFGVWLLTLKLATALASAVVGIGLGMSGYTPNVEQSSTALLGIKLLYGPVPAVLMVAGFAIFLAFPITRERHADIQRALLARRGAW